MEGNRLSALPSLDLSADSLTSLNLASNLLTLGPDFGPCGGAPNLTDLNLASNMLPSHQALPEAFGEAMPALTTLNLSGNQLQSLPSSVGKLQVRPP